MPEIYSKFIVTKSNELITAGYRLNLIEQRLILLALSHLDARKPMPKVISVSASDYSIVYGIDLCHSYGQMREAVDKLYERDIQTFDQRGKVRKRWVDKACYLEGEGRVEISFTEHIKPYLTRLSSYITSYDLCRISRLSSVYALRLFEMLMQFRSTGWVHLEIEQLRLALVLPGAYQRFNNLRQRVIDPAVTELNEKSGLRVQYTALRKGNKVLALRLTFSDLGPGAMPGAEDEQSQHELTQDELTQDRAPDEAG